MDIVNEKVHARLLQMQLSCAQRGVRWMIASKAIAALAAARTSLGMAHRSRCEMWWRNADPHKTRSMPCECNLGNIHVVLPLFTYI